MARWTSRLTTVRFEDANGLGISAGPGPGDLSTGGENAENAEHIRKIDRGRFDGFVLGDDLEQEMSLTVELANIALTSPTVARWMDFIKKKGAFSAAVSLNATVWAFKAIVTMNDGVTTTTKTYPVVQGLGSFAEAKEGSTFSFAGTNNGIVLET